MPAVTLGLVPANLLVDIALPILDPRVRER
jgi:ABC-type dipeptide/oligopeptide/nickel transport system permease component